MLASARMVVVLAILTLGVVGAGCERIQPQSRSTTGRRYLAEVPRPEALSCTQGDGRIDICWKQSDGPGVTGYEIYRWEYGRLKAPMQVYKKLPAGTLNFSDTGLVNGTTYFYAVFAVGAGNRTSRIAQAFGTPAAPPPPPAAPPPPEETTSSSSDYYQGGYEEYYSGGGG